MFEREPERMLQEATRLVRLGVSVLPTGGGISPKAKQPHHEALKATGHRYTRGDGKVCSTWRALQERLPTQDELEAWYVQSRARGIGFVTGQLSGWVVVDVDPEGLPLLTELGWTPHVLTPSGGAHFYVRHPGWYVPSNASKSTAILPPGFDVRGDGGYVMYPPSRNQQGAYHRTDHRQVLSVEDIPVTVTAGDTEYSLRAALGLVPPPRPAQAVETGWRGVPEPGDDDDRVPVWLMLERAAEYAPHSRNKGAFMFGLYMHANDYAEAEAVRYADEYTGMVQGVKTTPFTAEEARSSIQSAYRYPKNGRWTRQEENT